MRTFQMPAHTGFRWLSIALALMICMPFNLTAQPGSGGYQPAGVIAIDPGHGGNDHGAKGTGGTLEKTICLALAQKLAEDLSGSYKVVLTRNGDYNLPNIQRTAIANHNKADVLISLHMGAAFMHGAEGITLYEYQSLRAKGPEGVSAPSRPKDAPIMWRDIQMQHATASSALAEALRDTLQTMTHPDPVRTRKAPLQILAGADMPAVVIEVGYLTHPQTEKNLNSDTQLTALARTIANGIDAFMTTAR